MSKYQICDLCTGEFEGAPIQATYDEQEYTVCSERCKRLLIKRERTKSKTRAARRLLAKTATGGQGE
jgi:ribosome-binding protein aMBF1 (putative translation factor)